MIWIRGSGQFLDSSPYAQVSADMFVRPSIVRKDQILLKQVHDNEGPHAQYAEGEQQVRHVASGPAAPGKGTGCKGTIDSNDMLQFNGPETLQHLQRKYLIFRHSRRPRKSTSITEHRLICMPAGMPKSSDGRCPELSLAPNLRSLAKEQAPCAAALCKTVVGLSHSGPNPDMLDACNAIIAPTLTGLR